MNFTVEKQCFECVYLHTTPVHIYCVKLGRSSSMSESVNAAATVDKFTHTVTRLQMNAVHVSLTARCVSCCSSVDACQGSMKISQVHPVGILNPPELHGNPSDSCQTRAGNDTISFLNHKDSAALSAEN